jgi:hypothetical protein
MISRTPVLVTAFNRPQETQTLLSALRGRLATPLYVAIDGPRVERTGDARLVGEVRDVVSGFASDFELIVINRPTNLGCGASPREAVTEVLTQHNQLIVLEDDCIPSPDFLVWADDLLTSYEQDVRVGAICGFQSAPKHLVPQDKLWWASRLFAGWGWGTWRRAWHGYQKDLSGWQNEVSWASTFKAGGNSIAGMRWFRSNWNWVIGRDSDIWDHQFGFLLAKRGQVVLKPPVNLIQNVGTNERATHTTTLGSVGSMTPSELLPSTATKPGDLRVVTRADRWVLKHDYQARSTLGWLGDLAKSAFRPSS